jgi:hypothetical protein
LLSRPIRSDCRSWKKEGDKEMRFAELLIIYS